MQYHFASEIRNVVHELHQKIESTYLAFRMMHGIISKAEYAWILTQLHYIHQYLEQTWKSDTELSELYDLTKHSRLQNIKNDLNIIVNGEMPAVDFATQRLCEHVSKMYQENIFSLIGAMYVLEGSRLGSVYLSEPLSNSLKLEDTAGASYFLCTPELWYKDWYRFKENINLIDDLPRHIESINNAAVKTFEGLITIYQTKPV